MSPLKIRLATPRDLEQAKDVFEFQAKVRRQLGLINLKKKKIIDYF